MEIQEVTLNGVTYIPKRANPYDAVCTGCALDGKCKNVLILGKYISPCSLFGEDKILKIKEC